MGEKGIIRVGVCVVKALHKIGQIAASVRLGADRRVRLVRNCGNAADDALQSLDPATAATRALAEPLEFPPLSASIVPGDRVAIAVDEGVPCAPGIVCGVVESLRNAGIEDDAISVVTRDTDTSRLCGTELQRHDASAVQLVVHDPDDERQLCLVGVTKQNCPLVVNRTIFDADVVLPIGCARLDGRGVYESLFPRFSSAESIERFRAPARMDAGGVGGVQTRETDEAGWLIGVPMVMEVVPGADETVAYVLAGEPAAVAARSEELCRQQWGLRSARRASLVMATVTGGSQAQNWTNVARALAAAERLVADGGAVAICSNVEQPPGESLGRLIGSEDLAATERRLLNDHADDSVAAWQLARALQRGPVYFLSQLDPDTVEDLGMAPVADIEELARLASRHESVCILEDSQHALATVDGEEDEL
jgi:nickel-dependent lactate racemase